MTASLHLRRQALLYVLDTVIAADSVGISVYGVTDYGSYWYPGGLNLNFDPAF